MTRAHQIRTIAKALACSLLVWLADTPAGAGDAPACKRETLGQAACFTSKLCECIYDRGGAITGIPAGYRWDCGNLRPNCGEAADAPATINEFNGPYPLAIGIDRSDQSIEIE